MKTLLRAMVGVAFGSAVLFAQSVISAQSGTIHYLEGDVLLAGKPVEVKFGEFPQVKENTELKTELGRVEVLLTPGVFVRLAENSALRMITTRLVDTRLEFLAGSMAVEVGELLKDNHVTIVFQDATVMLEKRGLYRFNSQPAELKVYDGEVTVQAEGRTMVVKEGKRLAFGGEWALEKFDLDTGDSLDRWSRRRAEYVAMANLSAAKSVYDSERAWSTGSWFWNPYFGMFTFIPARGVYMSPYGFRFWSPYEVYRVYRPRPIYVAQPNFGGGGGYSTVPHTSGGYSGTVSSAASSPVSSSPSTAAAASSSAPVSRGSSAGGRDQ